MDELHALERQEALRRAEYEARHAEALRRAESHDVPSFRLSNARDREKSSKSHRRLSGPAWQMTPASREPAVIPAPPAPHSRSATHIARADRRASASPPSEHTTSDSEPITMRWHHPTPSTSPFLGPLRTLTLHSRASSPPPLALDSSSTPAGSSSGSNGTPHPQHLAHSVRLAFGMTPIHGPHAHAPHSPTYPGAAQYQRTTSWPSFPHLPSTHASTPSTASSTGSGSGGWSGWSSSASSVPGSRSGSPPIHLPPLKIPANYPHHPTAKNTSNPGSNHSSHPGSPRAPDGGGGEDDRRVELPGFSQFEAAARLPQQDY
ncbi:hypothetical protein B0H10DRAFT_899739 [Mycena sp. CBHHK59/15]|nr:hypothetical protein B0H10DRAFT_899739 [Mycena sp. CBHHK59/15]